MTLYHGLLFTFRNPAGAGRSFVEVYAETLRQIQYAEDLGYDTIWLTEHHFAEDGYSPSVMPIAGAVAARTRRARIGSYLALTSFNNAIRFAEDAATVDLLSNGRLDLALGMGYAPHEFTGFGVPQSERRSRYLEFMDVIQGLWTNEYFSYQGRHYQIDNARLMPKPVQSPHPPIWVGARAPAALDRAAAAGFHFAGGTGNVEEQRVYDEALLRHGRRPADHHVGQLYWVHVAESDERAWENAAAAYHWVASSYGAMLAAAGDFAGDELVQQVPPVKELRAEFEARVAAGEPMLFEPIFGSPETVGDRLERAVRGSRHTHLVLSMHLPALDPVHAQRSMELFGKEIRPRLDAAAR